MILLLLNSCASGIDNSNVNNSEKERNVPGWFWSYEINSSLKIHIQFPSSYTTDPTDLTKNYPVVYLLDGDWYFYPSNRIGSRGISNLVTDMTLNNQIPELILVGVCEIDKFGDNMRGRDFHSERETFFAFLQKELIPYINQNYRTAVNDENGNTLIGHSSGGHFTLFSLFSYREGRDSVFTNYISLSGSIDEEYYDYIYSHEEDMYQSLVPDLILKKKLFIGTGGSEEDRFITGHFRMRELLTSRNYKEFTLSSKIFDNLNHGTIVYPGIEEGLRFIFKKNY